jgi:hypothetical protein
VIAKCDAVLRRRAIDLADAFVTLDAELARRVEGTIPTATIEALHRHR